MLHGNRTYLLQDDDGQILEAHSISAGLDYPGIGPEHSWLHDIRPGRVRLGDRPQKRSTPSSCAPRTEGIIPALEPSHALAHVCQDRARFAAQTIILLMNMCGRGDKDVFTVAKALGVEISSGAV